MKANIAEDLLDLAYPIENLKLLPGNYNKGNVEAVAKSYKKFKQRKPISARRDLDGNEYVLAGNTQLLAARDVLGWTHIAVSWSDDLTDIEARAYAIADNRTSELAETDQEALVSMLKSVEEDFEAFDATGYDLADMQAIQEEIERQDADAVKQIEDAEEEDPDLPESNQVRDIGKPVIQYTIIFDNESQQQTWFSFLRWLKREYPESDTLCERLDEYLLGIVPEGS